MKGGSFVAILTDAATTTPMDAITAAATGGNLYDVGFHGYYW